MSFLNIDLKFAIHELRISIIEFIETSQNSDQNGRDSEALQCGLQLGVTVHEFMLISICQCLCHNDSIMESWFHRSRGVSGFIVSCVSWFHRFSGVNRFMVS